MSEFIEEIDSVREESLIRGLTPLQVFFERFSEVSTERGDGPDFDPCFLRGKNSRGASFRLDGWAFESFEAERGKQGINVYAIGCFFNSESSEPLSIGAQEIDKYFAEIKRAIEHVMRDDFLRDTEVTDESSLELAFQLKEARERIATIKLLVFSNGVFGTQRKNLPTTEINGIQTKCSVLDWKEYQTFSCSGTDPIVINLHEATGGPVPCIQTAINPDVSSYLLALPGDVVADLFQQYDNRLLESNVRTYLQARTQTNKGILKTVASEPHLFFAYNNGITATASAAEFVDMNGMLGLVELTNLQIVNGGQTTASLLYAREQNKTSLEGIQVQVKLNIISDEASKGTLVPNISRFSNTQNKVTEADLISTEAFQSDIERAIKNLSTPKLDRLVTPNWFYERARGQYKSLFMYKRSGERDKLKALYPKEQSITKTDLAKFYMSLERQPHMVAKGAQKCFLEFSKKTAKAHANNNNYINEAWAQDVVGRTILFRRLDTEIARSDWYKSDRGFKSQIVTYTIATLSEFFAQRDMVTNTKTIWADQDVHPQLLNFLVEFASAVGNVIKKPPAERSVRNPGEFSKAAYCWNLYVAPLAEEMDDFLERFGMPMASWTKWMQTTQQAESMVSDMELWKNHLSRSGEISEVIEFLKRTDQYNLKVDRALGRAFQSKYKDGDGFLLEKAFSSYESS